MARADIRLAGSGGQGIILASVILAEAAVEADKKTAQSQSYGPEARGGACKAEVIISDEEIAFTKVIKPSFFMALTSDALRQYYKGFDETCTVLIDEDIEVPEDLKCQKLIKLPILKTAKEKVGKAMTANIVAVACINKLLNLVNNEDLHKAVMAHIPKGSEELNEKALSLGENLAEEI